MALMARRRLLLVVTVGVFVVAIQTRFCAEHRVLGVVPDLATLSLVAVAIRLGPESAAAYGFGVGLGVDAYSTMPFGLGALSYGIVGYGAALAYAGFLRASWWIPTVMGGIGSAASAATFALAGALVGQDQLLTGRTLVVVVSSGALGVPLASVLVPLFDRVLRPVALDGFR